MISAFGRGLNPQVPDVETKFKTLRLFAAIQIIVGVLFLVAGVIALLILVGVITSVNDRVAALVGGASGLVVICALVLTGITYIAFGQFLLVVMQIEENTRK